MAELNKYILMLTVAFLFYPFSVAAENVAPVDPKAPVVQQDIQKPPVREVRKSKPLLTVNPEEMHLGTITADDFSSGNVTLKNAGGGAIQWSTEGPDGWKRTAAKEKRDIIASIIDRFSSPSEVSGKPELQKLTGVLEDQDASLRIRARLSPENISAESNKSRGLYRFVEMEIESGGSAILFRNKFPMGTHKAAVKINSSAGQKTVTVSFTIAYIQKAPLINLHPMRLDMGSVAPGKTVSRKIFLTNIGKEMLTWSVAVPGNTGSHAPADFKKGRYVSLMNEENRESETYSLSENSKDMMEFSGRWTSANGYPSCGDGESSARIHFKGTGIILYFINYPEEGSLSVSLNRRSFDQTELFEELRANAGELLIADNLEFGHHTVVITGKDSPFILEGVKILGHDASFFPERALRIFPNSGATTRQTNYLTVSFNPANMTSGYYIGDIVFKTNGGDATVEVFAEVLPDTSTRFVDVYRYFNGEDYLYTADPEAEMKRLVQNNYVKEGIAFRLFVDNTPGTTRFFRWYHPHRKSHFYHHDQSGGGKDLRGYIFEGAIGNIATSRLTHTRELYRWYNMRTGRYFYTTDIKGGKINRKIYRFEGIAGYVR